MNLLPTPSSVYFNAAAAGLRPDPILTVSEWADKYRQLSPKASAEKGPWRTSRTPYLREIMDNLSAHAEPQRIVFMKGAQVGGTECGNNWLGYVVHQAPGPMLLVQPTVELARRNSKQRLDPMIEDSEILRALIQDPKARDSGNTILSKEFPGGVMVMTGANSSVGLRSMPARNLFMDEVDAYPGDVDEEGDPMDLAIARTRTYSRRKIFIVSTPAVAGLSKIEAEYEKTDKRKYFVPCPECGHFQVLKWGQVRWPKGEPELAKYVCEFCQTPIENHRKHEMLARGEWRPTADKPGLPKSVGYHLSSLYSPVGWFSWGDAAIQFEDAQKNPTKLQVFVNTVLGETWTLMGEAPDWQNLYDRRDDYPAGTCPQGALFLTAGADVQKDRIEVQVVGWGRRRESWVVDHVVLMGDPTQPKVWTSVDGLLSRVFPHESGAELMISKLAIDSGYATQDVYWWARSKPQDRVLVVKGYQAGTTPIGQPVAVDVNYQGRRIQRGMKVWSVATSLLKSELYGFLKQPKPVEGADEQYPDGYCHISNQSDEFFRQLVAEQLTTKVVKGYRKLEWVNLRPGQRNEALDTRVYARAAACQFGIDRFTEREWTQLEQQLVPIPTREQPVAPAPSQVQSNRPRVIGRFI